MAATHDFYNIIGNNLPNTTRRNCRAKTGRKLIRQLSIGRNKLVKNGSRFPNGYPGKRFPYTSWIQSGTMLQFLYKMNISMLILFLVL